MSDTTFDPYAFGYLEQYTQVSPAPLVGLIVHLGDDETPDPDDQRILCDVYVGLLAPTGDEDKQRPIWTWCDMCAAIANPESVA